MTESYHQGLIEFERDGDIVIVRDRGQRRRIVFNVDDGVRALLADVPKPMTVKAWNSLGHSGSEARRAMKELCQNLKPGKPITSNTLAPITQLFIWGNQDQGWGFWRKFAGGSAYPAPTQDQVDQFRQEVFKRLSEKSIYL